MRSTVYFADLRATTKESFVDKIGRLADTAGLSDCLKKRDLVAVKLHFGELGNTAFIRPVFLGKIVDHIRRTGALP
ncbi:MAG: 4Fe-4S ferredoxin, partial [Desulfobacterales bacterium]|nr:4Fe-4S ferredoxin [Desulfobacterales bacterium]